MSSGDKKYTENEVEVEQRLLKMSIFKKNIYFDRNFYKRTLTFLSSHSWKKKQAKYEKYQKKPYERQTSLVEKSWFFTNNVNILIRFHETAGFLKTMTNSEGYYLYIMDETFENIFIFPNDWGCFYDLRYKWSIRKSDTIACYVMRSREPVVTDTRETDIRFLTGQDIPGSQATTYVLAVPLLNLAGHAIGVLELYRENEVPYDKELTEYVSVMASFVAQTITQNKKRATYSSILENCPNLSIKLNEAMMGKESSVPFYITCMEYVKKVTDAQKVSVFLIRDGKLEEEINTDFAEGLNKPTLAKELKLANLTFKSGWILNIVDLFNDSRFDKTEELESGNIIRSVLNLTLGKRKHTVGVLQAINKLSGGISFSPAAELALTAFANFAMLWYYYSKEVDHAIRMNKAWNIYANNIYSVISNSLPMPVEALDMKDLTVPTILKTFNFKLPAYNKLSKMIFIMIQDIAGKNTFDPKDLYNFINMTKIFASEYYTGLKNSAQTVQFLFAIFNIYPLLFSHEEQMSLIIAGFCSTIVRQYDSFEKLTKRDDALLYIFNDYVFQRNAFRSAKFLIKCSDLLQNIDEKEQEDFIDSLEENILSTNYSIASGVIKEIRDLMIKKQFDCVNLEHQKLLKALIMFVSANHCYFANTTNFRQFLIDIYEDIMHVTQGDEVDKPGDPEHQRKTFYAVTIRHMETIVLPYCSILTTILPRLSEVYNKMVYVPKEFLDCVSLFWVLDYSGLFIHWRE